MFSPSPVRKMNNAKLGLGSGAMRMIISLRGKVVTGLFHAFATDHN
jgi:hypothetical protein